MGARERMVGNDLHVVAGSLGDLHLRRVVRVPSAGGDREGRLVSVLHAAAVHGLGSMTTLELALPGSTSRVRVQSTATVTVVTR